MPIWSDWNKSAMLCMTDMCLDHIGHVLPLLRTNCDLWNRCGCNMWLHFSNDLLSCNSYLLDSHLQNIAFSQWPCDIPEANDIISEVWPGSQASWCVTSLLTDCQVCEHTEYIWIAIGVCFLIENIDIYLNFEPNASCPCNLPDSHPFLNIR